MESRWPICRMIRCMKPTIRFVLIPFGVKSNNSGQRIDFDAVYQDLIAPGVGAAGMTPLRADHDQFGSLIHKPMLNG